MKNIIKICILALVGVVVFSSCVKDPDLKGLANVPDDNDSTLVYTVNDSISFDMIRLNKSVFNMGSKSSDATEDEKPSHMVTLAAFYIAKYEVTEKLWMAVMGENPSYNKLGDNYPVENVSWDECQNFIDSLNMKLASQLKSVKFAMPTEAQWEYAARGGVKTKVYKYAGSDIVSDVAQYGLLGKRAVGLKAPNELGIHDMSGNVWEWCQDWYGEYEETFQTNPTGPTTGTDRVRRGGSWNNQPVDCRTTNRDWYDPDLKSGISGLRLVLVYE